MILSLDRADRDRSSRQDVGKDVVELNNAVSQLYIIYFYRFQQQENSHSSRVCMKHSAK